MATRSRLQHLSDTFVVEIAQQGSLEACDELMRRFRGGVVGVAGQIVGSREAAEDVAQEAFLLAFGGLAKLENPARFAGWLYTIARHRALRSLRREGRCEAVEVSALEYLLNAGGGASGPLDAVLQAEARDSVRCLFARLSPDVQRVLFLFYYEQWPAPRIADFLSLPLTTVKWRLHSGKRQIGAWLAPILEEKTHE